MKKSLFLIFILTLVQMTFGQVHTGGGDDGLPGRFIFSGSGVMSDEGDVKVGPGMAYGDGKLERQLIEYQLHKLESKILRKIKHRSKKCGPSKLRAISIIDLNNKLFLSAVTLLMNEKNLKADPCNKSASSKALKKKNPLNSCLFEDKEVRDAIQEFFEHEGMANFVKKIYEVTDDDVEDLKEFFLYLANLNTQDKAETTEAAGKNGAASKKKKSLPSIIEDDLTE
jgi:hypothetical protein